MRESREYPARPIVGVGGVVVRDGQVLLIRRAFAPLQGEWSIPGGGLDVGETIAQGVQRELIEETGIEVRILDHIETFERIMLDDSGRVQYHYVILDYLCEAVSGELAAGGDATEAAWVAENELPSYSLRETAARVILKAFAIMTARNTDSRRSHREGEDVDQRAKG